VDDATQQHEGTVEATAPGEERRGERRAALLDRVTDYVLEHGISNLTLRGVAQAVGSNNRMLLYYFDSREQLVMAALESANHRFPALDRVVDALDAPGTPIAERLERVWTVLADPANRPFHRLFFEVMGIAGFERADYMPLLGTVGTEWVDRARRAFADEGVEPERATALAHEVVALWRGLQVTLITSGDEAGVAAAAEAGTRSIVERLRRAG